MLIARHLISCCYGYSVCCFAVLVSIGFCAIMNKSSKVTPAESCTEKHLVVQQGFFFLRLFLCFTASCIRRENFMHKREKQAAVLATAGNISTSGTFDPVCGHWWKRAAWKWVCIYPGESIYQNHLCYKDSLSQHVQILGQLKLSLSGNVKRWCLFLVTLLPEHFNQRCVPLLSLGVWVSQCSALSLPLPFVPTQLHTIFV